MCLAMKSFHNRDTKTSWSACDLRKWLNNSFLKTAFSSEEQKRLDVIKHAGVSDKVSLISKEEASRIFDGYSAYLLASGRRKEINKMIDGEYTLYAISEAQSRNKAIDAARKPQYERFDDWWTCDVNSKDKDWAFCQDCDMTALEWESKKCINFAGVRPMIRIDLNKAKYYIQQN